MKKQIKEICTKLNDGQISVSQATSHLLDLFSALIDGCKTVVDGYESDGMEGMRTRDEVFYEYCKRALEHHYTEFNENLDISDVSSSALYDALARLLGLIEVKTNQWVNEHGEYYMLTKYGFKRYGVGIPS